MQWIKPEDGLPELEEFVVGMRDNGKWEQLQYSPGFGWTDYLSDWVHPPILWCRIPQPGTKPTLDTVWNEIQRLISVNARHRRGFTMQECDADKTLDRAEDEFEELVYANAAAKPMELGDTVAVLLYYAHCLGLTQHDLAELMLEKFKLRFTEG